MATGLPSKFESKTTVNPQQAERTRALYTGPLNPDVQKLYSIAIFDSNKKEVPVVDNLDPSGTRTAAEFFFSVPPKTHEFTEPFATTVVPTQNGGKFIESHGSIIKSISLKGTTGVRPNPGRRAAETIPIFGTGISNFQDELDVLSFENANLSPKTIPDGEVTGYDDIIFLRNIFRHYSDLKENSENAGRFLMLWRNAKDTDYWVVEPVEFKLSQSSSSPLAYEYGITLKTLSRFSTNINFPEDPMEDVLSAQRFFSRVQEYNQSLKQAFLIVSSQINRLEGLGVFAQTQLLSPIINTLEGLNLVKNTVTRFGSRISRNARELDQQVDDALEKLRGSDNVDNHDPVIRTLSRLKLTSSKILTEPTIKETVGSSHSDKQNRMTKAYNKGGTEFNRARQAPVTGGSSTFIGNEPITDNVSEAFVHQGDTIRTLAKRLLGDQGRWHVLVSLNDLRSPYVSARGGDGVLEPGDAILYPSVNGGGIQSSLVGRENSDSVDIAEQAFGPVEQAYGRDLRLVSVPGSNDLTDLKIGQNGDISSVSGVKNVDQGIRIKFSTEAGELPVHPEFGARFPIGSKATQIAFNEFRIQAEATIYSDQRVDEIKSLNFALVGDSLLLNATIRLKEAADSLNTSFALRRF